MRLLGIGARAMAGDRVMLQMSFPDSKAPRKDRCSDPFKSLNWRNNRLDSTISFSHPITISTLFVGLLGSNFSSVSSQKQLGQSGRVS